MYTTLLNYSSFTSDVGISNNFTDYFYHRDRGFLRSQYNHIHSEYGLNTMIERRLFKEHLLNLGDVNKIFCSLWLSPDQIVMGTKCNKLLVYNINSKKVDHIPCLSSSSGEQVLSAQCGIHALKLNPSKTLLATGAQNSNELAIYRLPTLDPVCMGEAAHTDWIFDVCWLDDRFVVSGCRDKSLALWMVEESFLTNYTSPNYGYMSPLMKKKCFGADKVRSLLFNPNYVEIVALSLNAKVHVWDATVFKQTMSQKLEMANENVCMTGNENCSIYAVGSKSHVTLIDPRTLQSFAKVDTRRSGPNIRSISFKGSLLTIGTGAGDVLFYDVNAGRHLEASYGSPADLSCARCQISSEDPSRNFRGLSDSAIYTHCYDWSGTRLFAAGGPLSSGVKGCYSGLWC